MSRPGSPSREQSAGRGLVWRCLPVLLVEIGARFRNDGERWERLSSLTVFKVENMIAVFPLQVKYSHSLAPSKYQIGVDVPFRSPNKGLREGKERGEEQRTR